MKKDELRLWSATFLRVLCGFILFYASLDKIGEAAAFVKVVKNYHVVPPIFVPLTAVVIPWLEFFVGLALITGFRWRGAALIYTALMGIYAAALAWNLIMHISMTCGCFAINSTDRVTWFTVLRDVVLFAMGAVVLVFGRTRLAFDNVMGMKGR